MFAWGEVKAKINCVRRLIAVRVGRTFANHEQMLIQKRLWTRRAPLLGFYFAWGEQATSWYSFRVDAIRPAAELARCYSRRELADRGRTPMRGRRTSNRSRPSRTRR